MQGNALVFAGQGSQYVGMGKDLAEAHPACRSLFDRADAALGVSLSRLCFEGPQEELTRSNICQPAVFVTSAACCAALRERMPQAQWGGVAGLSLGEWTALHTAGALGFEDAVRVLEARGRFMQEACETRRGGMISVIGLSLEALREVCARTGMEIANLNSPGQTVLSGSEEALEEAERLAAECGAKRVVRLAVAGAFHSSLMAEAARRLESFLADVEIRAPRIPVAANATGLFHGGPDEIRAAMVRQVTNTVQWVSCVTALRDRGVARYVECGPGQVLTGLIRRIDRDVSACNVQDLQSLQKTVDALQQA